MNRIYLVPKIIILTLILILLMKPTEWYHILLYIAISAVVVAIYTILWVYTMGRYYATRLQKGKPVDREKAYYTVHKVMKLVNSVFRVQVSVKGYENFDQNKNYLITPNHQSNQDILVVLEAFKDRILFVSKQSLSKVILVKDWMYVMDCLFLKKDDLRSQIIVMGEVQEKLKNQKNVVLFPEGKRSFSHELNPFKAGAFKLALKTGVDILPVTLNHVHKFRHNFPWRTTHMEVHIHPSIPYETYQDMSTSQIADTVKEVIASKIKE